MIDDPKRSIDQLAELTATIVGAYVANNSVPAGELSAVIASVAASVVRLGHTPDAPVSVPLKPAVSVKKSVNHEYLISLEDGKQYRTLKRHLGRLGLTAQQYRDKWGLPANYPMVAPAYAEKRAELARTMGLGRKSNGKRPTSTKTRSQSQ